MPLSALSAASDSPKDSAPKRERVFGYGGIVVSGNWGYASVPGGLISGVNSGSHIKARFREGDIGLFFCSSDDGSREVGLHVAFGHATLAWPARGTAPANSTGVGRLTSYTAALERPVLHHHYWGIFVRTGGGVMKSTASTLDRSRTYEHWLAMPDTAAGVRLIPPRVEIVTLSIRTGIKYAFEPLRISLSVRLPIFVT
jgi:hypothetical protein